MATKRRRDRSTSTMADGPTLALEPPGTMAGPGFPPVPVMTSGLAEDVEAPATYPQAPAAPTGFGQKLRELFTSTPSPGANMTKWLVPVGVFVLVWWLTGGLGWAILAAIAAFVLAAWLAKKATTPPASAA